MYADPEGGGGGGGLAPEPPLLKNQKAKGICPQSTGRDPLKSRKNTNQHSMFGHHQMTPRFKWYLDPLSSHQIKKAHSKDSSKSTQQKNPNKDKNNVDTVRPPLTKPVQTVLLSAHNIIMSFHPL